MDTKRYTSEEWERLMTSMLREGDALDMIGFKIMEFEQRHGVKPTMCYIHKSLQSAVLVAARRQVGLEGSHFQFGFPMVLDGVIVTPSMALSDDFYLKLYEGRTQKIEML